MVRPVDENGRSRVTGRLRAAGPDSISGSRRTCSTFSTELYGDVRPISRRRGTLIRHFSPDRTHSDGRS